MTVQMVDGRWGKEFTKALQDDSSELRIVCPFIKVGALQRLLCHYPSGVQVITRFNLADFAELGPGSAAPYRSQDYLLPC